MQTAKAAPPRFEIKGSFFKVTLFPINGGENDLLAYIQKNPGHKINEIRKALNIPQRSLKRNLKKLCEANIVEFRGVPKIGGYFTTKHNK